MLDSSELRMPNLAAQSKADSILCELVVQTWSGWQKVKPDDHSEVVPLLPIPNRTVKRLSADDSADSRVKVGHRQANTQKTPGFGRAFLFSWSDTRLTAWGFTKPRWNFVGRKWSTE